MRSIPRLSLVFSKALQDRRMVLRLRAAILLLARVIVHTHMRSAHLSSRMGLHSKYHAARVQQPCLIGRSVRA